MNTASLPQKPQESHLKVLKNLNKQIKEKIYVNTLFPGFSYVNHKGETIAPRNYILL